jgi:hypothetical protein
MIMKKILLAMIAVPSLLIATTSIEFPERITYKNYSLVQTGVAELSYQNFIRAYTGAFYMEESTPVSSALNPVPKKLIIEYHLPIRAKDFAWATEFLVKRNVSKERFSELKSSLDELGRLYEAVDSGDRYSLVYLPGEGTELLLNNKSLGILDDTSGISRELFSLWIGTKPIDVKFKNEILGMK